MFFIKSMVAKFAFWSVILLVLVAATFKTAMWNNQIAGTPDFNYWQGQYKQAAAQLASSETVKEAALNATIEVKQVTVLQFPLLKADGTEQQRVDRCQSCHAGLLNPNMTAEKHDQSFGRSDGSDRAGRGLSQRSQA